jgi:sulfur carrier protein
MKITVNGQPTQVPENVTIEALLHTLSIAAPRLAVEVNGDVIVKSRHALVHLKETDAVEIVTLVGGG